MKTSEPTNPPMEEPLPELERQLLADASLYATAKLTEVESRSHYLRSLRGEV